MKMTLDDLQEKARVATREALRMYPRISDALWSEVVLGSGFEGNKAVFDLYVPRARPDEAIVLLKVCVDRDTGVVDRVTVFEEAIRQAEEFVKLPKPSLDESLNTIA